jgi:hypothetical protein
VEAARDELQEVVAAEVGGKDREGARQNWLGT